MGCLPKVFAESDLPWPWPGHLLLYGRSMGSWAALHLAAVQSYAFNGLILDSAFAQSFKPAVVPSTEIMQHEESVVGAGGGLQDREPTEFNLAFLKVNEFVHKLVADALRQNALERLVPSFEGFAHVLGTEDKLHGYDGRLLILHGMMDTIVPPDHARRMCNSAESATRRLVMIQGAGHNDLSFKSSYQEAFCQFIAGLPTKT